MVGEIGSDSTISIPVPAKARLTIWQYKFIVHTCGVVSLVFGSPECRAGEVAVGRERSNVPVPWVNQGE